MDIAPATDKLAIIVTATLALPLAIIALAFVVAGIALYAYACVVIEVWEE